MAHKRSRHKVTACDLARSTSLRSMSFVESKVGKTERKLSQPKLTKADKLRITLLRHCAQTGDMELLNCLR